MSKQIAFSISTHPFEMMAGGMRIQFAIREGQKTNDYLHSPAVIMTYNSKADFIEKITQSASDIWDKSEELYGRRT